MKNMLLLGTIMVAYIATYAQTKADTIYYDAAWKATPTKATMAYYRVINKEENLYKVADYYKNGKLQMTGSYSLLQPEIQQGQFKYYDDKGKVNIERNFVNDQMDGDYKKYYPSGKLQWQIQYKKGINDGAFVVFYENGITRRKDVYLNGKFISGKCYTAAGKDTTYFPYEVQPEFVGGNDSLVSYFYTHMNYVITEGDTSTGVVYVNFFIDQEGNVRNAKIAKTGGAAFDDIALDAVKRMPPWIPGRQDGQIVKMPVTLPIRFGK